MPNGKPGDNPLTDLVVHGRHPFPEEIEAMLWRVDELGRAPGRWPLGENWPFPGREFDWAEGRDLAGAREALTTLIDLLEAGRGDEMLMDPGTGRPFQDPRP
jgi:hypothetical protein